MTVGFSLFIPASSLLSLTWVIRNGSLQYKDQESGNFPKENQLNGLKIVPMERPRSRNPSVSFNFGETCPSLFFGELAAMKLRRFRFYSLNFPFLIREGSREMQGLLYTRDNSLLKTRLFKGTHGG